jgi:hypothetical protein
MVRWFPRFAGIVLFLFPMGCQHYRENWCMEHGFVHANQQPQQAPQPQVYAPVAYPPQGYAAPVSYGAPNYAAAPYCAPAPNYCPPPAAGAGAPATWSQGR